MANRVSRIGRMSKRERTLMDEQCKQNGLPSLKVLASKLNVSEAELEGTIVRLGELQELSGMPLRTMLETLKADVERMKRDNPPKF